MQPDTLWVPERIAVAMVGVGIGKIVASCIVRVKPVPKAAFSVPADRPTPLVHYESTVVQGLLSEPDEIVLVDDIVTRGATLLGVANRLADAYPKTFIRAFAAMRTISSPNEFEKEYDPCKGTIELRPQGDTLRRP
jgi:adenine/guanine phosphoribosyltransferase-like PRPP-binding protein